MKRLAFISGTLCSSLFVMGALFKLMHWPGAAPLVTLGLVGIALIAIPSIAVYQYNNDNSK
ncbi:MAG TPA: hypothetical protein VFF27_13190 [Bacteroidia bacterium]|jgi:hypothetical protein|nr:hypothetical protein [Bacteroidia bacterium]